MSLRLLAVLLLSGCAAPPAAPVYPPAELPAFRAPAVPLLVQTPYLNVWLRGDRLTDDWPRLGNGYVKGMAGLCRIDGKPYRFLGLPGSPLPAMKQESLRVLPTRTVAEFLQDDVRLSLEFLSPCDPRDLDAISLPVVFVRAEVSAAAPRKVQVYLDLTAEWAVGPSERRITWDGLFRIHPSQPRVLSETHGTPDWGEIHWTALDPAAAHNGPERLVRQAFADGGLVDPDTRYPRAANDDWPVFAYSWDLGTVERPAVRRALVAHVRAPAVGFLGAPCAPYWTRRYRDAAALVEGAAAEAESLRARAIALDAEVLARARAAGGDALAALAALTFRATLASSELVAAGERVYAFTREAGGAGPIQNVETLASGAPLLLAFNPALLALQLEPLLEAARAPTWTERFAPRDLGIYPAALGPALPQDRRVESTATLVLLAHAAGESDPAFRARWRGLLRAWAEVLRDAGLHPDPQGSADDPPGAHPVNANLSLKSIVALALFSDLRPEAARRRDRWLVEADAADHLARAFGAGAGWSLKYNLFWDRLLGTRLVAQETIDRELAFYRSKANRFGTPLDERKATARGDALLLVAAVAPRADREAIAGEILRLAAEMEERVPLPEAWETDTGRRSGDRPLLGSVFAPVLLHERAAAR